MFLGEVSILIMEDKNMYTWNGIKIIVYEIRIKSGEIRMSLLDLLGRRKWFVQVVFLFLHFCRQ